MINKLWQWVRYPILASTVILGIMTILYSYELSIQEGLISSVSSIFWIGYFLLILPQVAIILHPSSQFWSRVMALAAVGLFSALPKILRSPSHPLYSDEFGHARAVSDILTNGTLSPLNTIVSPINDFPALHYLTAFITDITGFQIWTAANIVVGLTHVLTLLGIFALLRVKVSPRSAAIASLIYAANPNWMFFQSRFAYETLGVLLVVWLLVFVVRGLESPSGQRLVMLTVAGPIAFVLSQTHHISFVSGLILVSIYLAIYLIKNYKQDSSVWILTIGSFMWISIWSLPSLLSKGSYLIEYIFYTLNKPTRSNIPFVLDALGLADSDVVSGELGIASTYFSLPLYEIIAGALSPLILLSVAALYLFYSYKGLTLREKILAVAKSDTFSTFALVLVSIYFAILPFIFSGEYTFVRRSWSFLLIGFAILGALTYEKYLLSVPKKQRSRPPAWKQINATAIIVFILISYSSLANGATAAQRFPASESESVQSNETVVSEELDKMSERIVEKFGRNSWFIADRYTRLSLVYPGGLNAAPQDAERFPIWEFYINPDSADVSLYKSAKALGVRALVVHKLTFVIPTSYGYWFHPEEIGLLGEEDLYRYNAAENLNEKDWTSVIWDSENYVVYQVDWDKAIEEYSR